jgi:GT2 family glycosyltransferase
MDLTFCIVTYNVKDYLRDCLNSLLASDLRREYEVIVVDNHSQDGTRALLDESYPFVQLMENSTNQGYTRAMNRALQHAQGRYVIQLNADTLIPPGTFDRLVDFMDNNPAVGICTPKILNRDGTFQKQCRRGEARPWDVITYFIGLASLFPKSQCFGRYLQSFYPEDEINEVKAVSGSCMFIRREVMEGIGLLDERFFAYQEDSDYCMRARKRGWKVFYVPTAQIIHFGGEGGSKSSVYRAVYHWHRSYYLYYRKNLEKDYFFLFNWLYYLAMLAKLAFSLALTAVRRDKYAGTKKS